MITRAQKIEITGNRMVESTFFLGLMMAVMVIGGLIANYFVGAAEACCGSIEALQGINRTGIHLWCWVVPTMVVAGAFVNRVRQWKDIS